MFIDTTTTTFVNSRESADMSVPNEDFLVFVEDQSSTNDFDEDLEVREQHFYQSFYHCKKTLKHSYSCTCYKDQFPKFNQMRTFARRIRYKYDLEDIDSQDDNEVLIGTDIVQGVWFFRKLLNKLTLADNMNQQFKSQFESYLTVARAECDKLTELLVEQRQIAQHTYDTLQWGKTARNQDEEMRL